MGFTIANNVSSLTAQHHLGISSRGLDRSLERLASGFKVNRGADGPAALVISEKQRLQIAGLRQAIDNTEKGISLVQTAEGALTEINTLLVKIRSLAIDSANTGVNDKDALEANQQEIDNALDTIRRIGENTQFGIKKLLDGSAGVSGVPSNTAVTFVRGTSDTLSGVYDVFIATPGTRAVTEAATVQTGPSTTLESLTINDVTINIPVGSDQTAVIARINAFTEQTGVVADANGTGGATRLYSNDYGEDANIVASSDVADTATNSGFGTTVRDVRGTDITGTIAGATFSGEGNTITATDGPADGVTLTIGDSATNVLETAQGALGNVDVEDRSLVFQIGPNQYQTAKIAIDEVTPSAMAKTNNSTMFASLADIMVLSADEAQETIGVVDSAVDEITRLRGFMGAFQQNTLDSTAASLRITLENTVNAESVIRDTDFAVEVANFTRQQVLVQAGTSVLSSANQTSQLVLSLLQG